MDGLMVLRAETAVCLGRVISVAGSRVVILLENDPRDADGVPPPMLQIGALMKIEQAASTVYGMVCGLSIPIPAQSPEQPELRIVEAELLGEAARDRDGKPMPFRRGVAHFPGLGERVYATGQEDLGRVYACPDYATIRVGSIHQDRQLPARIMLDNLLGKHFAVLGTTGSGKSCAVTLILHAVISEHPNAHIVVLDPHDEYRHAFGEMVEAVDLATMELPYWLFNFEELLEVVLGSGAADSAEAMILADLVPAAKRMYVPEGAPVKRITVDTPHPYLLHHLTEMIDEELGRLDRPQDTGPYRHLKARLAALEADPRFAFMFGRMPRRNDMEGILSRLFRIPVNGRPVTTIDLSGVPSEVVNAVVSVLSRITFDFAVWSEGGFPILLVCEEAHRYAPQERGIGFEPTKRALARIAKEGRKYGVSLCVVSQRPSELATSVLAECNTVFAMRLTNPKDQEYVRASVAESGFGLLEALPTLRDAEAIVVGEGVPIPLRCAFDPLPSGARPMSGTARFSHSWKSATDDEEALKRVVERWRSQRK